VSIATRPKRFSPSFVPLSASELTPSTPPTHTRRRLAAEAPERGAQKAEAPESSHGRPAEAPDAGGGRGSSIEREFTHGRSQG
jgi:hypothetical protein